MSRKKTNKQIIKVIFVLLLLILIVSVIASIINGLQKPAITVEDIQLSAEEIIF